MKFGVEIETNARQLERRLDSFRRKQVPFAVASALTKTAFDARAAEIRDMPQRFHLRAKALPRVAVKVEKAKKRDWPHHCEAAVGIPEKFRFIADHELGTVRRSTKGGRLAIPTRVIKRTARGKIRKSQKPAVVARRKTVREHDEMLLRRRRGRDRREVLYFLRPKVRIRPSLRMGETVSRAVRKRFYSNFQEAFEHAVRTARR